MNGSIVLVLSLVWGLVAAGCTTSASRAMATSAPHSIITYTCAAGSLPVGSTYTRKSCTVVPSGDVAVLTATYTGSASQSGTVVDTAKLRADHWQSIDQLSAGMGTATRVGDALFFDQRAWLAYHYDNPAGTLSIEEAIPTDSKAFVTCGHSLKSGTTQREGLPLPSAAVPVDAGLYAVVPACMNDVTSYYQRALRAAGWTKAQAFQATIAASAQTSAMIGEFTRAGTTLAIWLEGTSGACTAIIIRPGA
ncbi:MAG TPA: hypothetical protein VGK33_17430 [Chloroflexota bacterium]